MTQSYRQTQEPLDLPSNKNDLGLDDLSGLFDERPRKSKSSKNSELDELFRNPSQQKRSVSKPTLRQKNEAGKVAARSRVAAAGASAGQKQAKLDNPKLSFDDDYVDFNDDEQLDYDLASTLYDIMESGNFLAVQEIMKDFGHFVTVQADNLRQVDFATMAANGAQMTSDSLSTLSENESLLRAFTSLALICYGGSWAQLASIFAAVEAFGTKEVLEEAMDVFQCFITAEPDEENDVKPQQIKDTFQKLGLQVALMIAVMFSPSWAEICIAVSFATKLTGLIPIEDLLSRALSAPDMSMTAELEEWFQVVDDEWFSLLSLLACNIFSLTLFGCFPSFVTAMYMGIIGLETLAECMSPTLEFVVPLGDMSVPVCSFERSDLFSKDNVHYVWGLNAFMALWQAYSGFTGTFQFLSWLMFLLPVVKIISFIFSLDGSETDKKLE